MMHRYLSTGAAAALSLAGATTAAADVLNMGSGLTSLETVMVSDAGNAADDTGYGAVDYTYRMSAYEITTAQWVEFLNAVASTSDTYGLFASGSDVNAPHITRSGAAGSYSYSVDSTWANRPINNVSQADAYRFINWLHNGQPTGVQDLSTTEDGSYFLNGATSQGDILAIGREADATWVLPTENEWYKAAFYDGVNGVYYDYATGTDTPPGNDLPDLTGNNANVYSGYTDPDHLRTVVGAFELSESPYGTFDQAGNLWEWMQAVSPDGTQGVARGAAFNSGSSNSKSDFRRLTNIHGQYDFGFRVALIPEPASLALLGAGLALVATRRRQ